MSGRPHSNMRRWYSVTVISLLAMIGYTDRFIMNLMVEPMKRDFDLTDTQVSLLIGITFSLFYVLCGLPLARIADRWNRRNLLTLGALVWSAMTAASGLAQNYWQLFVARIGIGIGESTITPCSASIFSDTLRSDQLTRGFAIYSMFSVIGTLAAFIVGGQLIAWTALHWPTGVPIPIVGSIHHWQLVFFIVGLPGILLALLFRFTVAEPKRQFLTGRNDAMPLSEVVGYIRKRKLIYLSILGGLAVQHIGAGALAGWLPALLQRKFGLAPDETGLYMALAFVLPGIASALCAGWVSDRLLRNKVFDSHLRVSTIGIALGCLPLGLAPLMPTIAGVVTLTALGYFFAYMPVVACPAALQLVSPNRMRAIVASLVSVAMVLIGFGTGPTIAALLTDFVFRDENMLDWSLAVTMTVTFIVSVGIFAAGRSALGTELRRLNIGGNPIDTESVAEGAVA